jgi:hypothetical protein
MINKNFHPFNKKQYNKNFLTLLKKFIIIIKKILNHFYIYKNFLYFLT